jgi:hypothetical protein
MPADAFRGTNDSTVDTYPVKMQVAVQVQVPHFFCLSCRILAYNIAFLYPQ